MDCWTTFARALSPRESSDLFLRDLLAKKDLPYYSREEFIRVIASIVATHPGEVSRPSGTGKGAVRDVIRSACDCDRVEWMLNLTRFMHELSREDRILMHMGTTSNESLHAELNSVFVGLSLCICPIWNASSLPTSLPRPCPQRSLVPAHSAPDACWSCEGEGCRLHNPLLRCSLGSMAEVPVAGWDCLP